MLLWLGHTIHSDNAGSHLPSPQNWSEEKLAKVNSGPGSGGSDDIVLPPRMTPSDDGQRPIVPRLQV